MDMNLLEQAGRIEPWLGRTFTCVCGKEHSVPIRHISIEAGALAALPSYAAERGYRQLLVVCDRRTEEKAGRELAERCREAGVEAPICLLEDDHNGELAADERAIVQLMLQLNESVQALVAVGSGTIHDIVRFVAHRAGRAFLSVPTAPSVDGFASVGAPLVIGGFKQTVACCAPEAIFADLALLAQAPRPMIAAGFGDMLGKYTSLADWSLGACLLGEEKCELAALMTFRALELCISHTGEIARGTEAGLRRLMEGLLLSGISMLIAGHSRPASGGEHHLSHYWEMKYLQQGRPALLHGAKVGAATVTMSRLYAGIAQIDAEEAQALVLRRLAEPGRLSVERMEAEIREAYGAIAEAVLAENAESLNPDKRAAQLEQLAARIAERWDDVRQIARSVPAPERLTAMLAEVGGPVTAGELGVPAELQEESAKYALYVRNRYTVMRLMQWLQ